ncbi:class I SAM-dependent methyltransferase [Leptolyngbya sp. FACHB-36]|uniref:class I SAM-dependent methyltransferase n=1 Tax=Leptolyngbya sp. FACHB-36 TaxID=2692808 RepID=UPI0016812E82|nr:class I SAM-dependent methyltransferase [Leptolyngbya sp. FACHB-36]MBD2022764.1 class I SAM-dependent methyltransferase [Leptolyngbya sp. FACHB-36]
MSKSDCTEAAFSSNSYFSGLGTPQDWQERIASVALRFNGEYQGKPIDLPDEVKAMPIYQERSAGLLQAKLTSPFWKLAQPQKNQRCLDIGCGVSFLIYPWRDWGALFYGQEISPVARDILVARGPQLNSKLFKGVELAPGHQLSYDAGMFDLAIATGVSCYYPLVYWGEVLAAVKRVLKPGGFFVFDVLDSETPLAENWAILEMYLGAEVFLEPAADWKKMIQAVGGQVVKTAPGELLNLYKVRF